jgi:hypothetical protein
MKQNRLCALWGWRFRRSMFALMIASYIEERNTRIKMLVLCAKRYVKRSGEMKILVLLRGNLPSSEMKKVSVKVMWYFPIIPCLKRLFRNKANAKLMR